MKVKLLTLQCIKNYGSVLQTYATERLLSNFFGDVQTIQYIRKDSIDKDMLNNWTAESTGITRLIKKIVLFPMCNRYKKVFNSFLDKYVHLTEQVYYEDDDFKKYPLVADAYCVGSDQVWNSGWNQGILPAMYLEFAPDEAMKFAFCSSFGKTELSDRECKQIKPLLERLQYITVRESTALDVLKQVGIEGGKQLLDPTLLLPADFWKEIAAPRMVKEDYVLVYQLNPNMEFDQYAYEFAKRKGMKLVFLGMRINCLKKKGKVFLMPTVEEFLSLIQHASYVITDSFHGTAFSLNFNREVIDIYPSEFSTRLYSILKWAGILSRHLNDFSNYAIADKPIDYDTINKKLEQERKIAMEYLEVIVAEMKKKEE